MSRIVGIDLGTSTSEIACVIDGAPVIIPNTLGKTVTPSVVHIGEDGAKLIGEPAAEYLLTRPDCTFMEVKRLMSGGGTLTAHGREYLPEEIQAVLLRYLAQCAETHLGETVDRAVITVPAYFTDAQRRQTAKAGELAGLKVERIINEPTAAALDYGLSNMGECKNILVYDFGGGTLDITVLELFEGVIDVKASSGNNRLGGKDFDEIIMRKLADAGGDERARMRLKKAAEECKIALSSEESFDIALPFLQKGKNNEPVSLERTVTRAELEGWIREPVESTREPMMSALADAKLSAGELDLVLLVGGSTRIPLVREFVKDCLGVEPKALIDPDLAVARGAAVQAGVIEGVFSDDCVPVLTDVCPYTLGISVMHESPLEDKLICSTIIPRNTTIPVEKSELFMPYEDYQTQVNIKVYQGDAADPEQNEFLGEVELTGLPRAKTGRHPVEVMFAYDVNGILQVTAKSVTTGKAVSAEINTSGISPRAAIDLSKWEEAEGAKKCRPAVRKAEKLIAAKTPGAEDLELSVRLIKEALLHQNPERALELREELVKLLTALEGRV